MELNAGLGAVAAALCSRWADADEGPGTTLLSRAESIASSSPVIVAADLEGVRGVLDRPLCREVGGAAWAHWCWRGLSAPQPVERPGATYPFPRGNVAVQAASRMPGIDDWDSGIAEDGDMLARAAQLRWKLAST